MKLKFLAAFLVVVSISLVFVSAEFGGQEHPTLHTLLSNINDVNKYLQENEVIVPPSVQKIITDGNIIIKVTMIDGSEEDIYISIENKRVTSVSRSLPETSAYDILSDEETVNDVVSSQDTPGALLSKYREGKIQIKAHGFGNNLKLFLAKIFLNFAKA